MVGHTEHVMICCQETATVGLDWDPNSTDTEINIHVAKKVELKPTASFMQILTQDSWEL